MFDSCQPQDGVGAKGIAVGIHEEATLRGRDWRVW